MDMNDTDLLQDYLKNRSEEAFTELVRRYVNFVHSTARRQVHDDQTAEEITQTVFCLLARKARTLTGYATLGGWLYRATCFTAAKAVRSDLRRQRYHKEAASMNEDHSATDTEAAWEELAPMLDEGLKQLGEKDRLAVLLRFFQQKPMREVGETLGVSEDAAKMRVARSVERLRIFFAKRGVVYSASALGLLLTQKSVSAAPASLTGRIAAKAFAGGVVGVPLWQIVLRQTLARLTGTTLTTGLAAALGLLTLAECGISMMRYVKRQAARDPIAPVSMSSNVPTGRTRLAKFARPGVKRGNATDRQFSPAELDELVAKLRKALHRTTDKSAPGPEVVEAVRRFGPRGDVAFAVLKEEAAACDEQVPSTDESQLPPHRAIGGVGFLDKSVPSVDSYLWEVYARYAKKTDSPAYIALAALSHHGFDPDDIPLLAERVMAAPFDAHSDAFVKSQTAGWIAGIIRTNQATTLPYVPAVEKLLDNPDAGIRFWAACALLEHEGTTKPKVIAEINTGLRDADADRLGWASLMLKDVGTAAKPIVPVLLQAGRATSNGTTREWALSAAAHIDSQWRKELPDVDEVMTKEEKEQAFLDKINSGKATMDDLLPALKDPTKAVVAAMVLSEMKPAPTNALPEMINALQGHTTDDEFDKIIKAIRRVDPQAALAPEDVHAVMSDTFKSMEGPGQGGRFMKIWDLFKGHADWCTRQGVGDFAHQLAAQDPDAGRFFTSEVLKRKPGWATIVESGTVR